MNQVSEYNSIASPSPILPSNFKITLVQALNKKRQTKGEKNHASLDHFKDVEDQPSADLQA
jgi:hypothetical protein